MLFKAKKENLNPMIQQLTSDTKIVWNPAGTLDGKLTTATGLGAIVFASIITTSEFLQS